MPQTPLEQVVLQSLDPSVRNLVVAVSGGMDSVVLLHLLRHISITRPLTLQVAHLDHQIRSESSADAAFVRRMCDRWQLPCVIECCHVPALAEQGGISLEMAGRQARRDFLQRVACHCGADVIALGHHQDDQVETFLLRLVRGSGVSGLAAMATKSERWWRPLLASSRQQIADYAQQHGLSWVEDVSNQDRHFVRNRLRHDVVPQLKLLNPRFAERIQEVSIQIQAEEDYWQLQVDDLFPGLVTTDSDGLRLSRTALLQCHPALRLRLLREALRRIRGDLQGVESLHLHAMDALLNGSRSQAQLDLPGCWVARRYETLWLRCFPPAAPSAFDRPVVVPGRTPLPDGRTLITTIEPVSKGETVDGIELDLEQLKEPLRVRSWCHGDRFAPQGMAGHKRLKRFFSDTRMELEQRLSVPLLVSGDVVLWIVGMRRSRQASVAAGSVSVVRVKLDKKADN